MRSRWCFYHLKSVIALCAAELRAEDGVDMLCREAYLSDADFEQVPPRWAPHAACRLFHWGHMVSTCSPGTSALMRVCGVGRIRLTQSFSSILVGSFHLC